MVATHGQRRRLDMANVILLTTDTGLSELSGGRRNTARSIDVIGILRDVCLQYGAQLLIKISTGDTVIADDGAIFIGYGIRYDATQHVPMFRDLRSIVAPFQDTGWPAATTIREYLQEFLDSYSVHVDRSASLSPIRTATAPVTQTTALTPSIAIVWDPSILSADEYAELVAAIGDIARNLGAAGIERVWSTSVNSEVLAGVSR